MKYVIDEEVLAKYNLTIQEFIVLLLNLKEVDINSCNTSLINKGLADKNLYDDNKLILSNNTKDIISTIIIDSDREVINNENYFNDIANAIREVFPRGKKPGTTYMWRDSTPIIAKKLKTLLVKFNYKFTKEEAVEATQRYVNSFNGDYQFMQLLKYFILKTDKATGEVRSDFMSYIENKEEENNNNWLNEII